MGQYIPDLWLPQLTPPRQPALVLELLAIVGGGDRVACQGDSMLPFVGAADWTIQKMI